MLPSCVRNFGKNALNNKNAAGLISRLNNGYATEATFETKPYKLHKLEQGPSTSVSVNRDDALTYFHQMQTIRRLETSSGNLYKEKFVKGFCHLYSGQEAVAVGIKAALRPQDSLITAYRDHGWCYLFGTSVQGVLTELTGRRTGCSKGKGGSMHMYAENFYGGNGIVGAQVPLGVGIAFAAKYKGTDGVCVALYGDGASNQGQIFEVYNMAKLMNIPCIFVAENNGYGMGTSAARSSASTDYYSRGDYIPGIWVDGMDVLAVREVFSFAVDYCKSGKGPLVIETATYRYSGHSMSDPGTSYRTREEVQEVRQTRDPITSFKEKIISNNLVTAEELKKMEGEIRIVVDEATKKAKSEPELSLEELTTDVYKNCLENEIRNVSPFKPLKHKNVGPPTKC